MEDNIEAFKRKTETLTDNSKEVCLDVNIEKTKYILMSRHQIAEKNQAIKIGNKSF
jgi:hypothetical protein